MFIISTAPKAIAVWTQAWLPTYFFAAVAIVPWIKRPYRIGVRSLLILTTIIAVLCVLAVLSNQNNFPVYPP